MRGRVMVGVLAALLLLGGPVAAQGQPPGGGKGGGRPGDPEESEPVPAQVLTKERRAGVAPSPQQTRRTDQTLQQLDQQLLHGKQARPPGPGRGGG